MEAEKQLPGKKEDRVRLINDTVAKADVYVRKGYLSLLDKSQILPVAASDRSIAPGRNLRLVRLESFVFDKDTSISQKIKSVYGALEQRGISAALILEGKTDRINLYLGVFGKGMDQSSSGFCTFLNSFHGTFPGCRYKNVKYEDAARILNEVLPKSENISVAALSGMPGDAPDTGVEKGEHLDTLVDGMRGKPFSMILLGQYLDHSELALMRQGLEALYTQIYPFQKQEISLSQSEAENYGINLSQTISESMTVSSGVSYGQTETTGTGTSTQTAPDNADAKRHQAGVQVAGAALAIAANGILPGGGSVLQGLFFGQGISNLLGNAEEMAGASPHIPRETVTATEHTDFSKSVTEQETASSTAGGQRTEGVNAGKSSTYGRTMQRSCVNKSVSGLLEQIERQLKQIDRLEHEGAFKAAAYFVAGDEETAASAANLYRSIVSSAGKQPDYSPIYRWSGQNEVDLLRQYLLRGIHPVFSFGKASGYPEVLAAQPIGLSDIPTYFCLPVRSLPGLEVTEHAPFSRDIMKKDSGISRPDRRADIGCIFHMGAEESQTRVMLSLEELTKHLFVSGATGVGKSNFCYQLISQTVEQDVKVLIVEPAKGEYAKVFGGREDFHVYGTNMRYAPLLRINPFSFPDGVHVAEHIDRLLDIFNAAWPMYSAMPAILKESIEEMYCDKGFDMLLGDKPENGDFPCFADLLKKLPEVINRSAYSGEVKGNYTGALITRVSSLTNGIYSAVFQKEEIGDRYLFDENAVIDLSRVGSAETKALLMGIIVMRLSEYRMCSGLMNSTLKHITLLEEAHHLLKKQARSAAEGADMRVASVEMITNAIAEMRTYGEGFVIADQSPSVMDPSVIRNTQTKVFFMLPDREDRRAAGDCISLTERQQQELAKLIPGAAVVFQSGWSDPVLSKINYYDMKNACPYIHHTKDYRAVCRRYVGQAIAVLLRNRLSDKEMSSVDADIMREWGNDRIYMENRKAEVADRVFAQYFSLYPITTELSRIVPDVEKLVDFGEIFTRCSDSMEIEEWSRRISREIKNIADLSDDEVRVLVSVGIQARLGRNPSYRKLYVKYLSFCLSGNAAAKGAARLH